MAKYDPNVKYGWEPDTKFELSGNEFGLILNTFRAVLQSPEARQILLINEANAVIETILSNNVESGNVTPAPEIPNSPGPMKVVPEK